jgi:putative oxidoreductase
MTTVSSLSSNTLAAAQSSQGTPKKALRATLWVVQALVGAAFIMAGVMKSSQPIEALAQQMTWVQHYSVGMVRFIGVAELLGGVGLILPALTRIKPILTPIAAALLTLVMVLAVGDHLSRGETGMLMPSIVLGALAAFIAWGRFKAAPIAPRA